MVCRADSSEFISVRDVKNAADAAPRRTGGADGFTLVELLTVIAIISLLAAIVFPVFATARGKARQIACLSNLRQIGSGTLMYASDYDGLFPYAKDASDYWVPIIWAQSPPACQVKMQSMPFLHPTITPYRSEGVLGSYLRNRDVWRCPGDIGFDYLDNNDTCNGPCPMDARPTMFEKYGASYLYRTELGMRQIDVDSLDIRGARSGMQMGPSGVLFLFDGNGSWHGSPFAFGRSGLRYNGVYADGHARLLTEDQYQDAWLASLGGPSASSLCP